MYAWACFHTLLSSFYHPVPPLKILYENPAWVSGKSSHWVVNYSSNVHTLEVNNAQGLQTYELLTLFVHDHGWKSILVITMTMNSNDHGWACPTLYAMFISLREIWTNILKCFLVTHKLSCLSHGCAIQSNELNNLFASWMLYSHRWGVFFELEWSHRRESVFLPQLERVQVEIEEEAKLIASCMRYWYMRC